MIDLPTVYGFRSELTQVLRLDFEALEGAGAQSKYDDASTRTSLTIINRLSRGLTGSPDAW